MVTVSKDGVCYIVTEEQAERYVNDGYVILDAPNKEPKKEPKKTAKK